MGILEFGQQVCEAWSQKNLAIWKLSHGSLTDTERQQCMDGPLAVMGKETGKGQGEKFTEVLVGRLFFLCHGNSQHPPYQPSGLAANVSQLNCQRSDEGGRVTFVANRDLA